MAPLVLLSDPLKEFPDNTRSWFEKRLPEPLNLTEDPGDAGLMSLSMHDAD